MTPGRALAVLLAAWAVVWPGSANAEGSDLFVSAAVSLREPLVAAIDDLSGSDDWHRGPAINLQVGGSSVLAQQVFRGAPTDLFLSASTEDVERLDAAELVAQTCRLGGNSLVVVVPLGGQRLDALPQLLDPRFARIGVANPRTSPLGRYTRQALEELNFEARLEDKRIPAEHARQVVDYVARGEVDAGVIYATDANRFADRVSIALKIDPDLHSPIVYQAALLEGDPPRDWAQRLFEFLCSDAGRTPWPGRR